MGNAEYLITFAAMMRSPHLKVILATVFWAMSGPFIKYIKLPVTTLSFFRGAVPVLLILLLFSIQKNAKLRSGNIRLMIGASVLNALRMIFYYSAYALTTIGNAIIVLYTWPILVALFSAVSLKEKVSIRQGILFSVAFSGIVFLTLNKEISFQDQSFLGMLAALISAALYASTVVIFKKEASNYGWRETIFFQNLVAAIIFLPFLLVNEPAPTITQLNLTVLYFAVLGVGAFGLFFSALQSIAASQASFLAYIELVFAMAFGVLFFGETLTWNILVGGCLVVGASLAIRKA